MTRGGGGAGQKIILHDEGGRGSPDPPKKDDFIYEQPRITYQPGISNIHFRWINVFRKLFL